MEFTTRFGLHSQTTRLFDCVSAAHRFTRPPERDCHPLWCRFPADLDRRRARSRVFQLQLDAAKRRFQIWTGPGSLAVTRGILVSFFSSA